MIIIIIMSDILTGGSIMEYILYVAVTGGKRTLAHFN